ncbi:MAG: 16S rRNA (cytosine(1402)-N(4))-methyltransferase RsmH [Elusimicrobia bacterium]|nr:16S rRNA (cytosine(1402)-N(4))-methyltransferase RsmH [Elusimicrobiota bacterium]
MTRFHEYTHRPVLLGEALDLMITDPDGLYLDATIGLGGHAEAILRRLSARGRLLGTDMDPEALRLASARLDPFSDRVRLLQENFRRLGDILEREKFFPLAGALFDLGVSSLQLDKASRGFSLRLEGPLDMRLDPSNPLTAGRILNEWPAEQLALLFKEFGEERHAQSIARKIVQRRGKKPFETTLDLSRFIESQFSKHAGGIHPATRVFMALRIAVNRELENLTRGLDGIVPYLQTGGRIAVITFHSLEDRIVKNVMRSFIDHGHCLEVTPSPVRPTSREVDENPRSRSAKLRVVEKQ